MPPSQRTSASHGLSGRRVACQSCRSRKKKCDGKFPQCSNCVKLGHGCFYTPTQATTADNLQPWTASDVPHMRDQSVEYAPRWPSGLTAGTRNPDAPNVAAYPSWTAGWDLDMGMNRDMFSHASRPLREFSSQANEELARRNRESPPGPTLSAGALPESQDLAAVDFGDHLDAFLPPQSSMMDLDVTDLDLPAANDLPQIPQGSNHNSSQPFAFSASTAPAEEPDISNKRNVNPSEQVPRFPKEHLKEILDTFFTQYHYLLPSIHRRRFIDGLRQDKFDLDTDPLPWAVVSVAGRCSMGGTLNTSSRTWLKHAKALLRQSISSACCPLHSVQAGLWITFHYFIQASLPDLWVELGQTCRLASLFGFDREDASKGKSPFAPRDVEDDTSLKEERRQTVWALYVLDRVLSSLYGWQLGLDDRLFMVNFPLDDQKFQNDELETLGEDSDKFTMDLSVLFGDADLENKPSRMASLRLIQKVSVLLGRIVVHNNHMHPASNRFHHAGEFNSLQNAISLVSMICAREASDVFYVESQDLGRFVWLQILVQMCVMLLYHPDPSDEGTSGASTPVSTSSRKSNIAFDTLSQISHHPGPSGFVRCMHAMHKIVMLVKETSNRSVQPLMNPFLMPAYFLCCRFLAITWHEKHQPASKENIDFMLLLVDRVARVWGPLASKFKKRILSDFQQDSSWASSVRIGDGNYLSGETLGS